MLRRRLVLVLVCASVIGSCWLAQAFSQQAPGEGERQPGQRQRGPRGEGQAGDPAQRMQQFRQRMQDQMRQQLGATEEEWKVLQPRIEKVQQLQREAQGGFRGAGRFGGRGQRPGGAAQPEGAPERQQSDVEKKSEALRSLLDDQASNAGAIKAALDALRTAREKAQQDLAAARKELRAVVTVRQEARLVLQGVLD